MTDKQSPTPEDQREAEEWVKAESPWDEGPDFKLERDSCREAYLAGVLRERERSKAEVERLREGLRKIAHGYPYTGGLIGAEHIARALLAAGEKAGGENEG